MFLAWMVYSQCSFFNGHWLSILKAIEKGMQSASPDIYEIVSENLSVVFWDSNVING